MDKEIAELEARPAKARQIEQGIMRFPRQDRQFPQVPKALQSVECLCDDSHSTS